MSEPRYFTVGELAQSVGVTVRTIQYYDQKGLLSPSAKGPQNQRLYTEEDRDDLYRILTLKYLGLSLSEIMTEGERYKESAEFHMLAHRQMDEIEQSFQRLFKKMTTLRALQDKTVTCDESCIDWKDFVETIEEHQGESQFFWRLTGIRDDELSESQSGAELKREEMVSKWHELIADTIRLMSEDEPVDGPRNRDLARRYLELGDSQQMLSAEQNFILMENLTPPLTQGDPGHRGEMSAPGERGNGGSAASNHAQAHAHDHTHGSFNTLRETVVAHLENVVAAYTASLKQ